jgi:hypothetical protein
MVKHKMREGVAPVAIDSGELQLPPQGTNSPAHDLQRMLAHRLPLEWETIAMSMPQPSPLAGRIEDVAASLSRFAGPALLIGAALALVGLFL